MRILLLPFHFKVYFAENTRVSGIDECMLKQYRVLSKTNEVKVFLGYSNIQNPDFVVFSREKENTVQRLKEDKQNLFKLLGKTIKEFKPDVILSNYGFNNNLYTYLNSFGVPILYQNHALPGQPADVFTADKLEKFLSYGHSLGCVSEFHKSKFIDYYSRKRTIWTNQPNIGVDVVVPSSFAMQRDILPAIPKTVRHISACNEEKGTFIIHGMSVDTDLVAEIFTTTKHVGGDTELEYLNQNLLKYQGKDNLLINYDIPHSEIMERIRDSAAFFVGKAQSDTFTITSIEALQCGIPLMIYGDKEVHPANNFVEPQLRQYIRYFKNRMEFYEIVQSYSRMTLDERRALADSCLRKMGEDSFGIAYTDALHKTIEKYGNREKNPMDEIFGF